MFPRRYFRRSLVTALLLAIVLLSLLFIYQNRHTISTADSAHQHDHHSPISHDNISSYNLRYKFHTKRPIRTQPSSSTPSTLSTTDKQPVTYPTSTSTTSSSTTSTTSFTTSTTTSTSSTPLSSSSTPLSSSSTPPSFNVYDRNQQLRRLFNAIQKSSSSEIRPPPPAVINTKNLSSFVHLDLKGAAPKVDYFEKLFPFLKKLGANGLLIEYEDMFPFTDRLAVIRHGLAYSKEDVQRILALAEENHLQVMPLLQVYGHLEYVLKLKEFMHLREDQRYPQVITPCLEESYKLLFDMIDQLLSLHPSIPYLHMGCDEVYYRLIHPQCIHLQFRDDADLFIRHVTRVAKYIKSKRPDVKLFIWHDMLSQLVSAGYHNITELIELVVPMVWAYVDDVNVWFDQTFWTRFALFPEVWVASSYKGSSGEITTMSYIGHHQRNQQTWLEAMYTASTVHQVNFTGIAVTGWSRYDHMLSLCELIPSSIPSLAYALQTIVFGRLDYELNETIAQSMLGCTRMPLWERPSYPTFISCSFPGHELYELMYQHDYLMRQYDETMAFVRLFITDVHIRQNYIHYKRAEECLERLLPLENQMIYFIDTFQNISSLFFTDDIGPEWIQTYLMRQFKEVQQRISFIDRALKRQSFWPSRPLPSNTSRIIVTKKSIIPNYPSRTI